MFTVCHFYKRFLDDRIKGGGGETQPALMESGSMRVEAGTIASCGPADIRYSRREDIAESDWISDREFASWEMWGNSAYFLQEEEEAL